MSSAYFEDQKFDSVNYSQRHMEVGVYEGCQFTGCDFSGADLSEIQFIDSVFNACNLSMTILGNTSFNGVRFVDCKVLGLNFENCREILFKVDFEKCILNFSSFYRRNLKKTVFRECSLQEADFTEADLTEALFDRCDLINASFEKTVLEKADLRTSFNYVIDPDVNRIKKARFSLSGVPGLLAKYNIEIE